MGGVARTGGDGAGGDGASDDGGAHTGDKGDMAFEIMNRIHGHFPMVTFLLSLSFVHAASAAMSKDQAALHAYDKRRFIWFRSMRRHA
jgi:hypothetical protein